MLRNYTTLNTDLSQYMPFFGEYMYNPNPFETICQLARKKNEKKLAHLVEAGWCIDAFQGEYNVVILLAKEGNVASVELLIDKFKSSRNHAVQGYACGGHIEQVHQQIAEGADGSYVVMGFAMGGHVEQVDHMIKNATNKHVIREYAVMGYAMGGHDEQVEQLLTSRTKCVDYAVEGYARAGHVDQVTQLIVQGANPQCALKGYACGGHIERVNLLIALGAAIECAMKGYTYGGHIKQVDQLIATVGANNALFWYAHAGRIDQVNQLIARVKNHGYRSCACYLAAHAYRVGGHINQHNILALIAYSENAVLKNELALTATLTANRKYKDTLLERAARLNYVMNKYQLGFSQSFGLIIKGTRAWLLQGPQLVREYKITSDIFWHITSIVLGGLSPEKTKEVFDSVHRHLFLDMKTEDSITRPFAFFGSPAVRQAEKRYQQRIQF